MASAKRDIRHIIDSFSEDLIEIAKGVVQEHVERVVSEWQAKNQKVLLRKSVESEKALRNQKALARIERVAARRREREDKKAPSARCGSNSAWWKARSLAQSAARSPTRQQPRR